MTARVYTMLTLSIALLTGPVLPAANAGDPTGQPGDVLDRAYARHALAGLTAAVAQDGEILWSGGIGFADLENAIPARPAMVHRIASISKPNTAVAVLQLVEQGKVSLDDRIRTHIPNFPAKRWPTTVEHALTHTSGIRHYRPGEAGTMENFAFMKKALRVFEDDDLLFEPGTKFNYTTYGYTTLGVIVEVASGKKFGEYLRDHVWQPADMANTRLEVQGEFVANRARGYSRNGDGSLRPARYTDLSVKYAGGGMVSNVEDLVRFAHATWDGTLLKTDTRDRMLQSAVLKDGSETGYSLGWNVGEADNGLGRYYAHSGGQAGTSTYLIHYHDAGLAIAIISNVDGTGGATREVARGLAERFAE